MQAFEVAAEKSKLIDEQAKQQSLRFHDYVELSHSIETIESSCVEAVEPTYVETVDSTSDETIKSTYQLPSNCKHVEKGAYTSNVGSLVIVIGRWDWLTSDFKMPAMPATSIKKYRFWKFQIFLQGSCFPLSVLPWNGICLPLQTKDVLIST